MYQGKNLTEVLTELNQRQKAKRDFLVPAADLRLEKGGQAIVMRGSAHQTEGGYTASRLFHSQLAEKTGIPMKYYTRMQAEQPDLLMENVNTWLDGMDSRFMVRCFVQPDTNAAQSDRAVRSARALLSDRYHRIDDLDVASTALSVFAGQGNYEVVSSNVSEEHMHLKIVNHALEAEVRPGDYVQAGVVISNSEVGCGAVSVRPFVVRLVCSNGMCADEFSTRKAHVGRIAKTLENSYELYSDETLEAMDKAFMLTLRDTALAAIEEARFMQIVGKLRESAEARITGRVQDVVELAGKNWDLTRSEQDSILQYLIEGGDLSLYGLSNAVTRASQDADNYDRATQLEGIGWQAASMPSDLWRTING